ncbi:MAG: efflux RND transporter periplasmic adaptor subunit [Candidatus Hydrogenedentes bacterium]|nr:efflux RND transporter periplasmic adaptor subunit [Candidatus Hydrogenedentota bacterium]
MRSRGAIALGFASIIAFGAEGAAKASAGEPPAVVEKISVETNQTTVKLSESAEKRLGVVVVPVERTEVSRQRIYGGTILPPPDRVATIIAPVSGTVVGLGTDGSVGLPVGSSVAEAQEIIRFLPLNASDASPLGAVERGQLAVSRITLVRARIDADARIQSAGVQRAAAKTALDRAEQLLKDKVGSQRGVDEARAVFELAEEALRAAKTERSALDGKTDSGLDDSTPVPIATPIPGVVLDVNVAAGQTVTSGHILVEVVDRRISWVRVPVTASEFDDVSRERGAVVSILGKQKQSHSVEGTWVPGPLTADALTSTIDLYFEIAGDAFRPGQRVKVAVFTKDSGQQLTVPSNAILYDIFGGAWVYVQSEERTYRRERVDILYTSDGMAVLTEGPQEGTRVVTDGAAELFGAEFGNDK